MLLHNGNNPKQSCRILKMEHHSKRILKNPEKSLSYVHRLGIVPKNPRNVNPRKKERSQNSTKES